MFVLVVLDDEGDVELLLKALYLDDAVLPQDHLHHVTPKTAKGRAKEKGELIIYRSDNPVLRLTAVLGRLKIS